MDKSSFSEYMLITKKLIEWSIKDMVQWESEGQTSNGQMVDSMVDFVVWSNVQIKRRIQWTVI